jgi:outer membrane lipoprotein SlyB
MAPPIAHVEDKFMIKNLLVAALITSTALTLGGCAQSLKGDVYSRDDARTPQVVRMGTIEALRPVQLEGTKSPVGAGAGAVVGGVAGSSVGGGKGSLVAAVIGAVAGGLLGAATEEGMTRTQAVEITVKEDNGPTRAYVQAVSEGEVFRVNDRVRIMMVNGNSRVAHAY